MLKWTWGGGELRKLKTAYEMEGTIVDHTSQDIILLAILDSIHYQISQKWQL